MKRLKAYVYGLQPVLDYFEEIINQMEQYGETIDYDSLIDWSDVNEIMDRIDTKDVNEATHLQEEAIQYILTDYEQPVYAVKLAANDDLEEVDKFIADYLTDIYGGLEPEAEEIVDTMEYNYEPSDPEVGIMYGGYIPEMEGWEVHSEIIDNAVADFKNNHLDELYRLYQNSDLTYQFEDKEDFCDEVIDSYFYEAAGDFIIDTNEIDKMIDDHIQSLVDYEPDYDDWR